MKTTLKHLIRSLTLGSLIASSAAIADNAFDTPEKAVEYRQNGLSLMQNNFAVMGDMIKGDTEFDSEIFAERAKHFAYLTEIPWPAFAVEGAQPGDGTDALPEIWDNWEDFQQRAEELQTHAGRLAEVAANGGDEASLRSAFMEAARSCKGCHDNYRD